MVNNLLTLVPFLIVFVMAIILIGSPLKIKTKSMLAFCSLFLALIFIFILLNFIIIERRQTIYSNLQNIQLYLEFSKSHFSYLIQGVTLCISLVIYFRFHQRIRQIHSKEFFISFYLIFTGSIMGLFVSENLLVISSFFILASISLEFLIYFDTIEKRISKFNLILISIFSGILVLTNIYVQITFRSLDLNILIQEVSNSSIFTQIIIFLGYFFGIGGLCILFPLSNLKLQNIYRKSNPIHLFLMSSIFIPTVSLILMKISLIFSFNNHAIAHIFFVMGCIGISFSSIQLIIEIFGLNRSSNQSIKNFIGLLSAIEFNIFLMFGGLVRLPIIIDDILYIHRSITIFFILSVITKSILIEILQPKESIDSKIEWNFESLRGKFYHKIFFALIMLVIPLFYAFPGFLGFDFFLLLFDSINFETPYSSLYFAEFWVIIILIIFFECILMILISNVIFKTYFQKSNQVEGTTQKIMKFKKITFVIPVILIIYNLIAIILNMGL
ncbi:hypothetical protein DSAG12_02299 [Promethearchaeum syntrophicum]|uniref:NADH:quinone oxidoreductase/Mrp antiporter membrane subunit domain-containing protein n=1 Tax=Promethearchaeum syntrophicum TaxID=2594042 RepID=A0A5B9DB41_9ARCH|nr:hypothetical protein [Candidatus Prometheoarchaeum syntrophicum]QEE16469.1 hypothetical protein DSAG12_02299 [Candidatus Prometheoarchaeum syntrophicum]